MNSRLRSLEALCLALTLTVVPGMICVAATVGAFSTYVEYQAWRNRAPRNSSYETLDVDSQGQVVVTIRNASNRPASFLDAERKPIDLAGDTPIWLQGCWLPKSSRAAWPLGNRRERPVALLSGPQGNERWFFVFDNQQGRAYFEAFDAATRQRIGFIGLNGFQQEVPDEAARFPINSFASRVWSQNLLNRDSFEYPFRNPGPPDVTFDQRSPVRGEEWVLHSGESVYLIDTVARSTRDLLPGHRVRSIAPVNRIVPIDANPDQPAKEGAKPRWEYQIWLAVRTDDRIVLLNPEAGLREEYVLPPIWRDREFSLYLPSDRSALLISYVEDSIRNVRPGFRQYENDVAWISSTGEVRRQTRVAIEHRVNPGQVDEKSLYWLPTVSVAGPLQSALVAGGIIPWFDSTAHGTRFADRAAVSIEGTWIGLLFVTVAAAGLAWLTDRRQRKFREPRSYMWMAFVFFLGIPGYAAYFCHRRWPELHPAPPPEKTGIEIFA